MAEPGDVLAMVPRRLFIGGRWVDGGGRFGVENPATGDELLAIEDASAEDGIRALDAAVRAAARWASTPARARSELLSRAYALVTERAEEFATLITLEMGKPIAEARAEVSYGAEFLRWFAEEAVRIPGRYGVNPEGTGTSVVTHRPVGPCFLITPWNFPLAMATRKIAPALAAGCTVVVKPAELTPLTTLLFARTLEEAGLPAGVVNVITTTRSAEVSAPIIADPRLRKLSFTGSTAVGRALLAQAADGVLRTSMELGGNAPFLIFEDADLERAVESAMAAKFRNSGQACTAANRFLVHESVVDEFAERIAARVAGMRMGAGLDSGVTIGPLIDERAVDRVDALVRDALDRGARRHCGGRRPAGAGHFIEPAVLSGVDPSSRLFREEIFGPVLGMSTFRTEEEAVELANATEYGLAGYVCTRDLGRAHRLIDSIETGMMGVNTGLISNASAPFGGIKQSGLGREGSVEGIQEYLATKYSLLSV